MKQEGEKENQADVDGALALEALASCNASEAILASGGEGEGTTDKPQFQSQPLLNPSGTGTRNANLRKIFKINIPLISCCILVTVILFFGLKSQFQLLYTSCKAKVVSLRSLSP